MGQPLTVKPGTPVQLSKFDPGYHEGLDKGEAQKETAKHVTALDDLSYRLFAEHTRALLLVLQGMDASGKDGTIRHVVYGIDPLTTHIHAFRKPNDEELEHDYLWRVHRQTPGRGMVGIFNRSHYEDVVVVRVHKQIKPNEWKTRYDQINAFEKLLVEEGVAIVKVFLHISPEEQKQRLADRLQNPSKYWKMSQSDLIERTLWHDYIRAYEDALTHCNAKHAPWYIVPADHKWYRNLVVSRLLHEVLKRLDPQFPPAPEWVKEKIQIE